MLVWIQQPLGKLKTINILVEGCQGLKGGSLISGVYSYTRHGSEAVNELVHRLMKSVRPHPKRTILFLIIFFFMSDLCTIL